MDAPHYLLRIHANPAVKEATIDFGVETVQSTVTHLEKLLNERVEWEHGLSCWCTDGSRHEFTILCIEDGKLKGLRPNHRVNAMIDAGRFDTTEFDYVDANSKNQRLKDAWGSNYFAGDIFIVVSRDGCIPDCSVFGEDPIAFILSEKTPGDRMKDEHGKELAEMMTNARMSKKQLPSGSYSIASLRRWNDNPQWELTGYHTH